MRISMPPGTVCSQSRRDGLPARLKTCPDTKFTTWFRLVRQDVEGCNAIARRPVSSTTSGGISGYLAWG